MYYLWLLSYDENRYTYLFKEIDSLLKRCIVVSFIQQRSEILSQFDINLIEISFNLSTDSKENSKLVNNHRNLVTSYNRIFEISLFIVRLEPQSIAAWVNGLQAG